MKSGPSKRTAIFLWTYLSWGGAQIYLLAIMKRARENWNVRVILPKGSSPEILRFLEEIGAEYEFIDAAIDEGTAPTLKRKLVRQLRRIRCEFKAYRYLRRFDLSRCVLTIDGAPPWQSWILLYFLTIWGHVFQTMHNALPQDAPAWRKVLWRFRLNFLLSQKNYHIFGANQDSIDSVKAFTSRRYWDKPILVRASIDPDEIAEAALRPFDKLSFFARNGLDPEKFTVLCVGQFIDRKGREIFLEAAKMTAPNRSDLQFVWLTPRMPSVADVSRIAKMELGESFKLILSASLGEKRLDVLAFFRVADIFALPSILEGLPIAILEAMALGIPVISTKITAIPEAIKHLDTGILIEPGSSKALAEAVLLLKGDDKLRQRLSEQGRRFVLEHFDQKVATEIALQEFAACLAENDRKR